MVENIVFLYNFKKLDAKESLLIFSNAVHKMYNDNDEYIYIIHEYIFCRLLKAFKKTPYLYYFI